ncbi:MAG TPA: hypothetical protein VN181_01355, partial [Thermoanaerobaculia bacterium]|nr:hypothetical protein [Thermoanaerobaculia bacterium]
IAPRADAAPQFFDVTSTEASFVRITPADAESVIAIRTLHVHGTEVEAPRAASLDGCWTINGLPARIVQNGARVIGVIGDERPIFIDGGSDGRVVRLLWTKLPQFGFAAVSVSPDGSRLSGVRWHEQPAERTAGDAWFGVRGACAKTQLGGGRVIGTFFNRAGRYPLYGLRFDKDERLEDAASSAALSELASILAQAPSQRFRIRANEFRETTPDANRAHAEKRLASLRAALASRGVDLARITFDAAGDTAPLHRPVNAGMRTMASSVDLQLR